MGMIWMSKMVLLSTLAALVIIAHSAEEDYEEYNRRELRPRILDTGSPRIYDQPWRTMETDMVTQQTTPGDTWMTNSSGEPPKRRRSGRKRKRRPENSSEESAPFERYSLSEEFARPYYDIDSERKVTDTPKRRRKKQEPRPGRWDSQAEEDRPFRRRVQKRKRPISETWPSYSDFTDHRSDDVRQTKENVASDPQRTLGDVYSHFASQNNKGARITDSDYYRQPLAENLGQANAPEKIANVSLTDDINQNQTRYLTDLRDDVPSHMIEDTSFSEFSSEDTGHVFIPNSKHDDNNHMKNKAIAKAENYFKDIEKSQNTGPINPQTLKEILTMSNGSSLSEILQQHNLTLADLLRGKQDVLTVLKSDNSQASTGSHENIPLFEFSTELTSSEKSDISETKYAIKPVLETISKTTATNTHKVAEYSTTVIDKEPPVSEKSKVEDIPKSPNMRKFSTAARRKQRIRPMMNTTYKSQLSRDMIALNARKYFNSRRRNNQERKDLVPMMEKNFSAEGKKTEIETTTVHYAIEETTIQEVENCTKSVEPESELNSENNASENFDDIEVITDRQKSIVGEAKVDIVQLPVNITEKPTIQSNTTPALNASGLRRQAFNNRIKKKRLQHKNLTTEPPQDDIMMNLFGIPNLVSSSEFIARTQGPKTSLADVTILEESITTEMPHRHESRIHNPKYLPPRTSTITHTVFIPISTEEAAKIEIEEIFNDTKTSEKLSRILKERNMTLSELVEHRERGSSHIHLADIFHNTSKEPNPPEPFLSKSLIEPISKETYPLRALLDANTHDTTAKSPTMDTVTLQSEMNIPVVMNFGNNVNENAENMGIMSLFHNITRNESDANTKTIIKKDSQGTLYETSITVVNTTDGRNENNTIRESRAFHVINDNQDDLVSWNEIFSLMRRNYENQTEETPKAPAKGIIPAEKIMKPTLEEDLDGDGVIVLEDLQHLKDFDSNIVSESNENLEFKTYKRAESTTKSSILDKIPSQTKSVTVATAGIAGLAMVLFLLTYVAYRWKQQRKMTRKKSFSEERVPTPVFENRKGHKNNSSSRSISPMLSSNIYTLNTLDSRNGKDSPDYMWDSLRKPFQ